MDNFSRVNEVVGPATKKDGTEIKGQGKKGPWAMFTVILENGTKLNVFGPVKEGDTVYDLEQSEQYHTWSGKVKAAGSTVYPAAPLANVPDMGQPTNAQVLEAVRTTYKHMDELFEKLMNAIAELGLDKEAKKFVDAQSQKPEAGSGSNRDYTPTAEEVDQILESGEPIDLSEIPF